VLHKAKLLHNNHRLIFRAYSGREYVQQYVEVIY